MSETPLPEEKQPTEYHAREILTESSTLIADVLLRSGIPITLGPDEHGRGSYCMNFKFIPTDDHDAKVIISPGKSSTSIEYSKHEHEAPSKTLRVRVNSNGVELIISSIHGYLKEDGQQDEEYALDNLLKQIPLLRDSAANITVRVPSATEAAL